MTTSSSHLRGAKILLVDDQPANLDVLRQVLEAEGYRVFLAPNGEMALKNAGRVHPDLILLDVRMPGMDGYEVCQRLKGNPETQRTPVVFVTAEGETEGVVAGFDVGGVDYIRKPFREREVAVRVRNALYTKFLFDENLAYQAEMERQLRTAHDLQMALMPEEGLRKEGFDLAGQCIPADHVGGDSYQYFELGDGNLAVCMADVTGHAMEAAIPTVLFSGLLESQMEYGYGLEELFHRLNRCVCRTLGDRTLVCFVMAQLDPQHGTVRLASGGWPYPYVYNAESGTVTEIALEEAYPLGVNPDTSYRVVDAKLRPGDCLVLCSDGITEAANPAGREFGAGDLAEAIAATCARGASAAQVTSEILEGAARFADRVNPADDQTIVVIEAKGLSATTKESVR